MIKGDNILYDVADPKMHFFEWLGASDNGTLSDGRAAPGFKAPVVGPPCDLMRVLGDVLVYVIGGLSRKICGFEGTSDILI